MSRRVSAGGHAPTTTISTATQSHNPFHVTAQRTDGGLDAVMHSAVFLLVDQYGVVRGVYSSEEPGEFKALVRDARTLLGAGAGPVPVAKARTVRSLAPRRGKPASGTSK